MNFPFVLRPCRRPFRPSLVLALTCVVTIPLFPQTAADKDPHPPAMENPSVVADKRAETEKRKKSFDEALAFAKSGDFAKADESLARGNRRPPGARGAELETAAKQVHLALVLRQNYDYKRSIAVARRALGLLGQAAEKSGAADAGQSAAAHEMAAFVHDELLRDPAAARDEFEKALRANPESKRARQGLDRLAGREAETERLQPVKKKEAS